MADALPSQAAHTMPSAREPLGDATNRGNAQPPSPSTATESIDLTKAKPPPIPQWRIPEAIKTPPPEVPILGKRKSPDEQYDVDDIDCDGMPIDKNPDQVRRMIRRFLDNGGMQVGEFCNRIGCSNNGYNRFMKQSGATKGLGSDVFTSAWEFFKKRELGGLKMPTKASAAKKAKMNDGGGKDTSPSDKKKGAKEKGEPDISTIYLDGEDSDSVPIYATCDDIRRQISAYLRRDGITKAGFCRDMFAQLHAETKGAGLTASQLDRYRGNHGANGGASSKVFYAAYVFFEKHRLAEGKSKSKKRVEMEDVWPNGFDRTFNSNTRYVQLISFSITIVPSAHRRPTAGSERPYIDNYGRLSIH